MSATAPTAGRPFTGSMPHGCSGWPLRERRPAVLHAVAEEGIAVRAIAETIGQALGLPVRSLSEEEAPAHFTWMVRFVQIDKPTSSTLTRKSMGWEPQQKGLLADMQEGGYFA